MPRAGADEMIHVVDKLYMDHLTSKKNKKKHKKGGKSVGGGATTFGINETESLLGSVKGTGQRKKSMV